MKWLHRIHVHRSTRRALDFALVVFGMILCLFIWDYYQPHPDLARWRALTGPTVRINVFNYGTLTVGGRKIDYKRYRGTGCGVIIARHGNAYFALTNHHIAGGDDRLCEIQHPNMPLRPKVHVLKTDPARDLALILFFADADLPVAPIAKTAPHPTAKIWVCGLGAGNKELRVSDGVLGKKSWPGRPGPKVRAKLWLVTAPVWWGDSGGGVWTDKYELFGLVCCKRISKGVPAEGQGGIIPLPVIRAFLKPMGFAERVSRNPGETHFCLDESNGENKD